MGEGFDGVPHLLVQRSLEADQIAGQHEIQNLPLPVFEQLVTKPPAGQNRIEMIAVATLGQDRGASFRRQLAGLEALDKFQFLLGELPKAANFSKRAFRARDLSREWMPAKRDHKISGFGEENARSDKGYHLLSISCRIIC